MSAVETLRKHSFGKPEDMGPPALERAAHQLMLEEADRRRAAETKIVELTTALAAEEADCETAENERDLANTKVGELQAELYKRGDGYRASLMDMDTKLEQQTEARMTAELLSAQYKATADTANTALAKMADDMAQMRKMCDSMMEKMQGMTMDEPESEDAPVSYRLEVVGRDAAGDLRSVDIIPVERK